MTTTDFTAQIATRAAVLTQMGAPEGAEWFAWPTASAALGRAQGALWIATDLDVAPDDADALATLLGLVGYDNGTDGPWATDPGEPVMAEGLCTWALALGAPVG
jgi:hypothetical protein